MKRRFAHAQHHPYEMSTHTMIDKSKVDLYNELNEAFKNDFAKCDRVVNDYTDTISAWTTTMLTPCQRSHRLCGHGVLFLFCLFDHIDLFYLLKRSTVIKSLLLIFLKDQP